MVEIVDIHKRAHADVKVQFLPWVRHQADVIFRIEQDGLVVIGDVIE